MSIYKNENISLPHRVVESKLDNIDKNAWHRTSTALLLSPPTYSTVNKDPVFVKFWNPKKLKVEVT